MGVFEKDIDVEEKVLETIDSNPEIAEKLNEIVGWEKNNIGKYENYDYSSNYDDVAWSIPDLPTETNPGRIGYLKRQGIITEVMSSNNSSIDTLWSLRDREKIEEALKISKSGKVSTVEHDTITEDDVPDDIFETIVGHNELKDLFMASIKAEKPVHILLVGPPACGKTVFLEEVGRIPESEFLIGSSTTGPGLIDELFDSRPQNILIDEFDKMEKDDYGNLLSLQEDGVLKETKGNNKRREMRLEGASVYGTANSVSSVPDENLSRFTGDPVIRLSEYDDDEFHQVTYNVLTMREGVSNDMAECIADIVVDETSIRDFRECRRIARLTKTESSGDIEERVRKFINIVQTYGSTGESLL